MDENLYFAKEFKEQLFNDSHLSFSFNFIKSSLLAKKHLEILEDLWNKFNEDINGSESKITIKILENKLEPKEINKFVDNFVNDLSRAKL